MIGVRNVIGQERSLNGKICTAIIIGIIYKLLIYYFSADWYKDQLTDEQLDALENPPKPKPRPVAPINRRKPSRKHSRPVDEEVEDK